MSKNTVNIPRIIVQSDLKHFTAARLSVTPFSVMVEYGQTIQGEFRFEQVETFIFNDYPELAETCIDGAWNQAHIAALVTHSGLQYAPETAVQ